MEKHFFMNNRSRWADQLEDDSVFVICSGHSPVKRGDEYYPYTVDRNFYYLTGLDKEDMVLTLVKTQGVATYTLYIPRFDEVMARWIGPRLNPAEAADISGIDTVKFMDQWQLDVADTLFKHNISKFYGDFENRHWQHWHTPILSFTRDLQKNAPHVQIKNAYYMLAQMRMVKKPEEIAAIRKAIAITIQGIECMMKNAKPGMMEYEVEAYFDFVLKKNGVRDKAFTSIAAAGKNATVLHYVENNTRTKNGDLILFDVGAQVDYYNGDITRTFPMNGIFTPRQKEIYNIVLAGQKKVMEAIRPGAPFKSLNEILKSFYIDRLKEIGLIQKDEELSRYYFHGVSHFLGLETHDAGRYQEGLIQEGMVFTVEPGLYIEQEELGVRIEDNILVTKNGCEVLSKDMIKTVEEIESFMQD